MEVTQVTRVDNPDMIAASNFSFLAVQRHQWIFRQVARIVDNRRLNTVSTTHFISQGFVRHDNTGGIFHDRLVAPTQKPARSNDIVDHVEVLIKHVGKEAFSGQPAREVARWKFQNLRTYGADHNRL